MQYYSVAQNKCLFSAPVHTGQSQNHLNQTKLKRQKGELLRTQKVLENNLDLKPKISYNS